MVNISVKTLGVYLNPMAYWKDQYEHIKNKIQVTIKKLMRTYLQAGQANMNFNMHILIFLGLVCLSLIHNR